MTMANPWKRTLIESASLQGVLEALPDYEVMLLSILDVILERFERNPGYRFIDTKVDILAGTDRREAGDPERDFKGKGAIYGWIQGRGLEALAGHASWIPTVSFLSDAEKARYRERITVMIGAVLSQMEELRAKSGGRLSFVMTTDGRPFDVGEDGRRRYFSLDADSTSITDLFYAKGLFSAARWLGNDDKVGEACRLFRTILSDVENDRCRIDQIVFAPKNARPTDSGRRQHGFRMISLLGLALFAEATGAEEWFGDGERFVRHVINRHINLGQWPELQQFDFVEATDPRGQPWCEAGSVLCDPGHALEFIGLAAKFLLVLQQGAAHTASRGALLGQSREVFPATLSHVFQLGFNRAVGGICDAYDLITRRPLNTDMPWWNLPETMRAAAELVLLYPDHPDRERILQVAVDCSNAFVKNFVNPNFHLMAYQTVSANGQPVDVIPATPDADPGYHTGLSIIDFIACIRRLAAPERYPPASSHGGFSAIDT
jgi:hypothetical protein